MLNLDQAVTTEDLLKFKTDYRYKFQEGINTAINYHKAVIFDLDDLPSLSTDMNELKKLMSRSKNIDEWNSNRELAKNRFTFTVISRLDASGFISKVIKK
ncbi:MAG: hypothetical protein GYA62_05245 [Bacteroidales bacterium]|nr:hypothetical protein [Bacteroidales bacterium]